MGKKKQYDAMMRQFDALLAQIKQPSPYESEFNTRRGQIRSFLDSKDYRNLPTGVNVDLLPLADYQRMRSMVRGTGDTKAKGASNSNLLAQQRQLDDDQFVRDWGGAYEQKVGELKNEEMGLLGSLQDMYSNRMGAAMQGQQAQMQNLLNRPKGNNILGTLFGIGMKALPSILAAV